MNEIYPGNVYWASVCVLSASWCLRLVGDGGLKEERAQVDV